MTPEREAEIESEYAEVMRLLNSIPHLLSTTMMQLRTASDLADAKTGLWSVVLFDGPHRLKLTFEVEEAGE